MPNIQNTYLATHAVAVEGMVADSRPCVVRSMIVEDVEGIGFGKVAVQGDTAETCTDAEASKSYVGISVLDPTQFGDTFAQYSTVPIMQKGPIWLLMSVAVVPGDPLYFVPATGVFTNVSSGNTLIPNARIETAAGIGALARVYLG